MKIIISTILRRMAPGNKESVGHVVGGLIRHQAITKRRSLAERHAGQVVSRSECNAGCRQAAGEPGVGSRGSVTASDHPAPFRSGAELTADS